VIRRHSLVWLSRPPVSASWQEVACAWQEAGNPFVACRTRDSEELSLGFCLPPADNSHPPVRIGVASYEADVTAISRPPDFFESAPRLQIAVPLTGCLDPLRRFFDVRVLGSRMWQALTGVRYVREESDLDLVLDWRGSGDLEEISSTLTEASAHSGIRLDAEISVPALGEIHWSEWFSESPSVLVKSCDAVRLLPREQIASCLKDPQR